MNDFRYEKIFDFWQKHYQEAEAEAIRASAALAGVQDHQEGSTCYLWISDLSLDSVLLWISNFVKIDRFLRYGVLYQVSMLSLAKDWELSKFVFLKLGVAPNSCVKITGKISAMCTNSSFTSYLSKITPREWNLDSFYQHISV